jgi:hypothetical protein
LALDRSAWALIAANLLVIGVALKLGMRLADMLVVYWIQSMIIGVCGFIRILSLKRFSSRGFSVTWGPVEETLRFRVQLALFFAFFYGTLHVFYLGGIIIFAGVRFDAPPSGYAICAVVFALNHGYSLYVNLAKDAAGRPNVGTVTMLPIARMLPMHLTIILGGAAGGGAVAMAIFLSLKVAVDVLMHCVEHKAFRVREPGEVYIS